MMAGLRLDLGEDGSSVKWYGGVNTCLCVHVKGIVGGLVGR